MGYSSRHIKFKWKDGIHCIVGLLLIVPFTIGYSPHAMSSHIPFNQVLLAGNNHEFKPSYTASFLASTSMVNTESQQQHFLQKSSLTTVTNIARKFSQIAEHDIRFIDSLKELFHSSDASNERDDLHILSQIRMAQERGKIICNYLTSCINILNNCVVFTIRCCFRTFALRLLPVLFFRTLSS